MGNCLFTSSIGRKLIMSISGLFLVLFLLFHMSMNLAAVFSTEAYNAICEFLGANWYALVGTLVLAAGFLVHIIYASILTLRNRAARGDKRYAVTAMPAGVSWASRNMYILGAIVVLGLILHLYNFWYKMQFAQPRRFRPDGRRGLHRRLVQQSGLLHHLPGVVRGHLVPPYARFLERVPDDRLGQPDLARTPQMHREYFCYGRIPRFRRGGCGFLPAQPVRRCLRCMLIPFSAEK